MSSLATGLKIIMWVLTFLGERGDSAPARKEKEEREKINDILATPKPSKDELNDGAARMWALIKRMSRSEGRGAARQ